jgi:hypothetical protein
LGGSLDIAGLNGDAAPFLQTFCVSRFAPTRKGVREILCKKSDMGPFKQMDVTGMKPF